MVSFHSIVHLVAFEWNCLQWSSIFKYAVRDNHSLSYHLALMYVHRFPIQCWRPFRPSRTNFMNPPSVNMLKCITKLRIIYRQAKVGRFRWFTTFPTRLAYSDACTQLLLEQRTPVRLNFRQSTKFCNCAEDSMFWASKFLSNQIQQLQNFVCVHASEYGGNIRCINESWSNL